MPQIVTVTVSQQVASAPSQLQKTGALISQGGTTLAPGTVALLSSLADLAPIVSGSAVELTAMATTFFSQGNTQAVYILELGSGTAAAGVAALTAYLANPSVTFYSYLVPLDWDVEPDAYALFSTYENTTAATYFYVTTSTATYATWLTVKSVFAGLQSPDVPITEFSLAAMFHATLSYSPSASSLVSPLAWTYLYGVTPYVLSPSNQTLYLAAGLNWVGTGAEGGISNKLIVGGQFMDLHPFNYWYSVDWLVINVAQTLSAAVINGSNNPQNPLYYNQNGINTLQTVAQATVNNGISFGLILSPATVTAVPFTDYVAQNPGDYAIGRYAGLACTFVPARGFNTIVINLTATDIPV